MNFKNYISGELVNTDNVNCLVPSKINVEWSWEDTQINLLLSKASYHLGVLNALQDYIPDLRRFVSGAIYREAQMSNEIEGTRTELEKVLSIEERYDPNSEDVLNSFKAATFAFEKIEKSKGFNENLLLETHAIIIGLGYEKRSKYKSVQNWIGGATKYDARFIPAPVKEVKPLMKDLIEFLNNENTNVPDLIKIAIAHYQFETIHPFNDGNGRLGRLLIPMYLLHKKILDYPLFVSTFLSGQRRIYYENLDRVRTDNDLNHWVKFFLVALKESAKSTIENIHKVHNLMMECVEIVDKVYKGKASNALELIRYVFTHPVLNSKMIVDDLKVSPATANSLLQNFVNYGILIEKTGNQRNREYVFKKYMNLLMDIKTE